MGDFVTVRKENCCGGVFPAETAAADNSHLTVFPGFADVHVHFREPGFSYKETIATGTAAAARGGYTAVCTMPNLDPAPDCPENLGKQLDLIRKDALINVFPYGTVTVGERGERLSDMEGLAPRVVAFSDDGRGVQSEALMLEAMKKAKSLGRMIAAHCEDESLLNGGYIHSGRYAALHGHRGISPESEWRQIYRDIELAAKTGCAYHVCHISAKESVSVIRQAKKSGVDVSCETAPHYLTLDESCLEEDGRFKMNPPLRGAADREALVEGLIDGTVDIIATDHAPHAPHEKNRGLEKSAFGIVGLETAFPVLYTKLVRPGIVPLETVVNALTVNPRERFGLPPCGGDCCAWDLNASFTVDPGKFLTKGRSTPFEGETLYGICRYTVCGGKKVYVCAEDGER